MTELKDKAIDIKGKQYVLVSDRVLFFNENYPNGCIFTERLSEGDMEIFKATIIPDVDKPERKFTWYSQAKWWEWFINKTAAMENAETSAVGRWLAMMGIWVIDSIASADEIKKAEGSNNWAIQKEVSNTDKLYVEKAWFNQENLDKFIEWKMHQQYKTLPDALKMIKQYYKISKAMEDKVKQLYESLETIKQ